MADEHPGGAPQAQPKDALISGVKHIIAISSGKGGVGKSTVSANLACALALTGCKVGLLDADLYGPNIPMMMGSTAGRPSTTSAIFRRWTTMCVPCAATPARTTRLTGARFAMP